MFFFELSGRRGIKMQMDRKMLKISSLIVLYALFCSSPGFCLDYYVNGVTGADSATCGQLPITPCKTIKKALDNIPDGEVTIKIARGSYVESELLIPVTPAGSVKNDITFEGGWNASFESSVCNPENTVVVPGDRTAPPYMYLFDFTVFGDQRQAALTLRCMKIQKTTNGDIARAISAFGDLNGLAKISLKQIRLTGFAEQSTIFLFSRNNGVLDVNLNEVIIDKNSGYTVLSANAHDGGSLNLTVKKSRLINNGSPGGSSLVALYLSCTDEGTLVTTLENTIIANNYSSIDPPAIRALTRNVQSMLSLNLINTTISGNHNASSGGNPGAMGMYAFDNAQCDVSMMNTIVRLNTSVAGPDDYFLNQDTDATLTFSADYCILGEHDILGSVSYASTHETDADPGLNSTYHLTRGSPAKDVGLCGYLTGGGPLYQYYRVAPYDDIDGDQRPGWGKFTGCDIGADEYRFPWIFFNPATRGRRNP
jgi:hypothetical protein